LSHVNLKNDDQPLQIDHWQSRARLRSGKIEIEKGEIVSPAGTYEISGTASLGRVLDFKLTGDPELKPGGAGSLVYSITGTVAEPRVVLVPTPETRAQLKQ